MNKNLSVVIVAAGASTRINSKTPKPFIKINSKPILWYSAYSFNKLEFVDNIFIVISKNCLNYFNKFEKKYLNKNNKFKKFILGGKERSDSVYNALQYIKTNYKIDFIAIHDAARPFIMPDIILKTFKDAIKYGSAAPGIQLVDTIKKCNNDNFITSHLTRENLIAIQTPQIFNFNNLINAYEKHYKKNIKITDDTEIYSKLYHKIKITKGDKNLLKITYKKDIELAKKQLNGFKNIWKLK